MRITITESQYKKILSSLKEDTAGTVKLYHTSDGWKDVEDFTRTGLWLSDYPDEAYGGTVYTYEVPKNLNIADQETAMSFAMKYDRDSVEYAASMAGIDAEDESDLYSAYDEVLIDPENFLNDGHWACMLRDSGYDGFCFGYAGGMFTYYYLFNPKIATLVDQKELTNYDDFETGVLQEEYHASRELSGPERTALVQQVCSAMENDPDAVLLVGKMPPKAVKRFKGANRIQVQGRAGLIDSVGFIRGGTAEIQIAVIYNQQGDYAFTENGDPDQEFATAEKTLLSILEEHGYFDQI